MSSSIKKLLFLFTCVVGFSAHAQTQITNYAPSSEIILNPERGFHGNAELTSETDLSWVRPQGNAMLRSYIRLDAYRNQALPSTLLQQLQAGFDAVRRGGVKVIPRFSYNFPELGETQPDAPLSRVLQHIGQLKPLLQANEDVIASMHAGFIGLWGEWHTSTNQLTELAAKRQILDAILAALPKSRMVDIRYPGDFLDLYPIPLTPASAFSGINQARVGHHNDCFLASADDVGTYYPPERADAFKRYLEQISPYVAFGGETCQVSPQQARTDCATALAEMQRYHWSYINIDFFAPAIEQWKREGCFNTIAKKLGYRFQLVRSEIPTRAAPGGTFSMNFSVLNDGWASPYNPRKIEIVLREKTTKAQVVLPVNADPRTWFAGQTKQTTVSATLPASIAAGNYDVLLNLPDPIASLRARADYSIRLANTGLWEATTGYNNLQRSVLVGAGTGSAEIILDNASLGVQDAAGGRSFTGAWCKSVATSKYGADSLYSCGTAADSYRWTPNITKAGSYQVYVWWSTHPNRSTSVPIKVVAASGTASKVFNEKAGGGSWVLHGTYNFVAGKAGYVEVTDANGQAAADAVRFVPGP
jgi:Domain of unknown function (DUF4832)/Domain of unknown function (DUF4874)